MQTMCELCIFREPGNKEEVRIFGRTTESSPTHITFKTGAGRIYIIHRSQILSLHPTGKPFRDFSMGEPR